MSTLSLDCFPVYARDLWCFLLREAVEENRGQSTVMVSPFFTDVITMNVCFLLLTKQAFGTFLLQKGVLKSWLAVRFLMINPWVTPCREAAKYVKSFYCVHLTVSQASLQLATHSAAVRVPSVFVFFPEVPDFDWCLWKKRSLVIV